ncbi:hypothetical protein ACJX0J_028858, partial [Zea mays]
TCSKLLLANKEGQYVGLPNGVTMNIMVNTTFSFLKQRKTWMKRDFDLKFIIENGQNGNTLWRTKEGKIIGGPTTRTTFIHASDIEVIWRMFCHVEDKLEEPQQNEVVVFKERHAFTLLEMNPGLLLNDMYIINPILFGHQIKVRTPREKEIGALGAEEVQAQHVKKKHINVMTTSTTSREAMSTITPNVGMGTN